MVMQMTRRVVGLMGVALLAALPAGAAEAQPEAVAPTTRITLFNGKNYDGWIKFLPDASADVDPVWTIRDGVIHCLGKPNGYIRTKTPYRDYRLHLEWRWTGEPTNSGVLLHAALPDQVWPKTVEAQLQHKNAGDFWLLSFSTIEDAAGNRIGPKQYANLPKQQDSSETTPGEWNAYDIVCDGASVMLMVNGVQQNKGVNADPASGYICLQSEGSPIQFRNIYLDPLRP